MRDSRQVDNHGTADMEGSAHGKERPAGEPYEIYATPGYKLLQRPSRSANVCVCVCVSYSWGPKLRRHARSRLRYQTLVST